MGRIKKTRLATSASIASVGAAIRALPAKKLKPRDKRTVKDIPLPHAASAAEINKLLAARGQKISEAIHKEEQVIAKIIEETAKQISKGHNFRK